MNYIGDGNWELEFYFDTLKIKNFSYRFIIKSKDNWAQFENAETRFLNLEEFTKFSTVFIQSTWIVIFYLKI